MSKENMTQEEITEFRQKIIDRNKEEITMREQQIKSIQEQQKTNLDRMEKEVHAFQRIAKAMKNIGEK